MDFGGVTIGPSFLSIPETLTGIPPEVLEGAPLATSDKVSLCCLYARTADRKGTVPIRMSNGIVASMAEESSADDFS